MDQSSDKITLSVPSYRDAINESKEFYIQFALNTSEVEISLTKIIHRFLAKYDILFYKETILAVLKELVNNAVKANVKRLYFQEKNLDLLKPAEYREGMETFKSDTYENQETGIFESLKSSGLIVRVLFKPSATELKLHVINSSPILDLELKKIEARVSKAIKYSDMSEAFDDVLDDSEGAGLGLIMAVMMMKNCGLPAGGTFKITRKDNFTVSTIRIPFEVIKPESKVRITESIIKEIDEIPVFPDTIKEIELMCVNPETPMKDIADVISRDPGLTTSILKLSNSAGYFVPKKIESIEEAVKIIGIRGIKTLLIATGVQKVIDARYKKFDNIWKQSYKKAFYAQKIAIMTKFGRISDLAYLAALLSDIGRIIMLALDPDVLKTLREISGIHGIEDSTLIEEISLGVSHTSLGGMICRKWGFDPSLISAIELHHTPYLADPEHKPVIYTVYLADAIIDLELKRIKYPLIDEDVLAYFKINDRKAFDQLHLSIIQAHEEQSRMEHV
jgi:HD-like signal output (HDOD) protein